MKLSMGQRFRDAIRGYMRASGNHQVSGAKNAGLRSRKFVEEIEPDLARLFLLDFVERVMRAEEHSMHLGAEQAARAEDPQMRLLGPGFAELFRSIRQRLPLKHGTRMLDRMTVSQLRESAMVLRAQSRQRAQKHAAAHSQRAEYLDGIADRMSPFAEVHRGLVVSDYLELCEAGVKPVRPLRTVGSGGNNRW